VSEDGNGLVKAVSWTVTGAGAAAPVVLKPVTEGGYSAAYGVGVDGSALGEAARGTQVVPVIWPAGSQDAVELPLGTVLPPGAAYGGGGAGWIVGEATKDGETVAVVWTSPTAAPVALATLGGATGSAYATNVGGRVVGESRTADGATRGALWVLDVAGVPGAPRALEPLPGHVSSVALSVSALGEIVGESQAADGAAHAVLWRVDDAGVPGPPVDLGLGVAAVVHDERIAGSRGAAPSVWDLRNLSLADVVLSELLGGGQVYAMNGSGWIVGTSGGEGFVSIPR
jgi:uncharacterized membrane protein